MKNKHLFWKLLRNGTFISRLNLIRTAVLFRLNQPLTLSEKILYSHADDPQNQVKKTIQ